MEEADPGAVSYQDRQEESVDDNDREYYSVFPTLPEGQAHPLPLLPPKIHPPLSKDKSLSCPAPPKDQSVLSEIIRLYLSATDIHDNCIEGNTRLLLPPTQAFFPEKEQVFQSVERTRQYAKASTGVSPEDKPVHKTSAVCNFTDLDNRATLYRSEEEKLERNKKKNKKKGKRTSAHIMDFAKSMCLVEPERLRGVCFVNYYGPKFEEEHLDTQLTRYLNTHAFFKNVPARDEKNAKNAADAKMLADIVQIHYNTPLYIKINIASGDRGLEAVAIEFYKRRVQYLSLHQRHDQNDVISGYFVEGPADDKLNTQKTKLGKDISELARSKDINKVYFIAEAAVPTCSGKLPVDVDAILNNSESAKLVFRERPREKQANNESQLNQNDKPLNINSQTRPDETQASPKQQMEAGDEQANRERHDKPEGQQSKETSSLFNKCKYQGILGIYETDPRMKKDAPHFLLEYAALALHYEDDRYSERAFILVTNENNAFANEVCKRCKADGRAVEPLHITA